MNIHFDKVIIIRTLQKLVAINMLKGERVKHYNRYVACLLWNTNVLRRRHKTHRRQYWNMHCNGLITCTNSKKHSKHTVLTRIVWCLWTSYFTMSADSLRQTHFLIQRIGQKLNIIAYSWKRRWRPRISNFHC